MPDPLDHRKGPPTAPKAPNLVNNARLLWRLVVRPAAREPARHLLTALCVSVGVAVVVAIDLAGEASAGSFQSSMESLQGDATFEISQVGGIPDAVFGELSRLEGPLEFSARVEGYATGIPAGERLPLFGVDLIGDESLRNGVGMAEADLDVVVKLRPVWVSASLGREAGEQIDLVINDRQESFTVRDVLREPAMTGHAHPGIIVMDIALAQRVLDRVGTLDRIYAKVPAGEEADWGSVIAKRLPLSASLRDAGVRTRETRKLLRSFRWNLQVLSYIALIVGAFLVYNAVSVSVVRRRTLIGVARALGMTSRSVRLGFLAEGCFLGGVGTALGLLLGRAMAVGAVELMGRTVESLYVSSAPGEIVIGFGTVAVAMAAGVGVSTVSAWWPAREASSVPPTEAMAKARWEHEIDKGRGFWARASLLGALLSIGLCFVPAWDRVPYAGFVGALGFVLSATALVPQVARASFRSAARPLLRVFGAAAMIGSRSLAGSLGRTAVIVAALSTATAMMVSVAIMVGSLRDTLLVWMDNQLQADLYIQAEGRSGVDDARTFSEDAAKLIEALPEVDAVDRFRQYAISYNGLPATLALADFSVHRKRARMQFLQSPDSGVLIDRLTSGKSVIASEAFASKHNLGVGDAVMLPIGDGTEEFQVEAVYYDYSAEHGYVIGHRDILLGYLPDTRLTSLAVYLAPDTDLESARREIVSSLAGRRLRVARNRDLRENAVAIFDRTFAITYALEAIAVFVAILGMAGALITLILDRRAELAVLRALGATRRQVRQLVLAQAGMLGLVSNFVGIALGVVLSVVLVKVINKQSFGWTIQFHWPVGLLVALITVIFAASLIAGIYPARVAALRNPLDAIREE